MPCERTSLLRRLAVEDPAALAVPSWRLHLEACADCRAERHGFDRSLAVFRHFEASFPDSLGEGPSWAALAGVIEADKRRLRLARLRAPLAAASLLMVVGTTALMWPLLQPASGPPPAQIVTLRPDQQAHVERTLTRTLQPPPQVERVTHADPARTPEATAQFRVDSDTAAKGAPMILPLEVVAANADEPRSARAPAAVRPAPDTVVLSPRIPPAATSERAPVMIFRSLQQRRFRSAPLRVLPALSPVQGDSGASLLRPVLAPRPIR